MWEKSSRRKTLIEQKGIKQIKSIIIHVTLLHKMFKTVQSTEERKNTVCLSLNQNRKESDDSVWVEKEYFCVGRRKK